MRLFRLIKKYRKRARNTIGIKLSFCFVVIISLMFLVIFYSNYNLNALLKEYDKSLNNYFLLNNFFINNSETHALIERYFITNSPQIYREYTEKYRYSNMLIYSLKNNITEPGGLGKLNDLQSMVTTYREKVDLAIKYFNNNQREEAYLYLDEAGKINDLIDSTYKRYFCILSGDTEQKRINLLERMDKQLIFNNLVIFFTILFCSVFVWLFARSITKPIVKLVKNAEQLSLGNFDVNPVNTNTYKEIVILSHAFNKMAANIKFFISEMQNKARLQRKLHKEEKANLEIKNILRETQIRALQARMNPHFLFNTLNIISKTAYLEEAEQTLELLEATTDLLRYNLDRLDKAVTLNDEISCIEDYIYIQNKRFGDRIKFVKQIQEGIGDVLIPSLIVQPLIENAIIHGVEDYVKGAKIIINIKKRGDYLLIKVADNGVGISKEKKKQILSDENRLHDDNEHKENIGIKNVKRRLELFYGENNILYITSRKNKGTIITIKLSLNNHRQELTENV